MLTTEDRQAITETLALQAFVVDDNRLDRLDEVFTDDVSYDMSGSEMGVFTGIDTVRHAAGALHDSGRGPLSHLMTTVVITDGGASTASVRSKGLMIMHDGGVHAVAYDDTLVQRAGRWLIARRVIVPVQVPHAAQDPRPAE